MYVKGEGRRQRITGLISCNFPFQSFSYILFHFELSEQWPIVKIVRKLKIAWKWGKSLPLWERFLVVCDQFNVVHRRQFGSRELYHWKCVSWRQCHHEVLQQQKHYSWREEGLGIILHLSATCMTKLKPTWLSCCLGWLYRHVLNKLSNFRLT